MIDGALHTHILSLTGIGDYIGTRLYPSIAPQYDRNAPAEQQLPYIIYQRISTPRERHFGGSSALASPRFQFSLYDNDTLRLEELGTLIREAFDTLHHTSIGAGDYTAYIQDVVLDDERNGYEPSEHGSELGLYRKDLDFIIWHTDSVPVAQGQT